MFTWSFRLLSAVVTAFALVSLVQKVFDVGLTPVMQQTLDSYRLLVHPLMNFLLGWVHWLTPNWVFPDWLKDLYALSFVGGSSFTRGLDAAEQKADDQDSIAATLGGLIFGATGLGLFAFVIPLFLLGKDDDAQDRREDWYITGYLIFAILGAIAFFAINAQH